MVEAADFLRQPIYFSGQIDQIAIYGILKRSQLSRHLMQTIYQQIGLLQNRLAVAGVLGFGRQLRPATPEVVQQSAHGGVSRLVEQGFHLVESLGTIGPLSQRLVVLPKLITQKQISHVTHVGRLDSGPQNTIGLNIRQGRCYRDPLSAVTGSVDVGDIVTDRLHGHLVRQESTFAQFKTLKKSRHHTLLSSATLYDCWSAAPAAL